MRNLLLKSIFGISLIFTPFFICAQQNSSPDKIEGTYTIFATSSEVGTIDFNEEQLKVLEKKRKEDESYTTEIGGYTVKIMSAKQVESNTRWAKYSILRK